MFSLYSSLLLVKITVSQNLAIRFLVILLVWSSDSANANWGMIKTTVQLCHHEVVQKAGVQAVLFRLKPCFCLSIHCFFLCTRSTGFILEGFPRTSDDVRMMTEAGLFPDAVFAFSLEEEHAVKRLLPDRMARWKEKMRLRLQRRKAQRAMRQKQKMQDRDDAIEKRKKEFWEVKEEERVSACFKKHGSQIRDISQVFF